MYYGFRFFSFLFWLRRFSCDLFVCFVCLLVFLWLAVFCFGLCVFGVACLLACCLVFFCWCVVFCVASYACSFCIGLVCFLVCFL